MSSFQIGMLAAFPAGVALVGMIFWPLLRISSYKGEHSPARKVAYRCGCTVTSSCSFHEEVRRR